MRMIFCLLFLFSFVDNQIDSLKFSHPSVQPIGNGSREHSTSSTCEGVSPDVRECELRGQPAGCHKRRIFPFPMPWVLVWITGIDGRGVVSSRGVTHEEYKIPGWYTPSKASVESQ